MVQNDGFQRYLLSKVSVDDRALNKDVVAALRDNLPDGRISIVEIGAGIGTMLMRMLRWDLVSEASYVLVDEMAENLKFGLDTLPQWASEFGYSTEYIDENKLEVRDQRHSITAAFIHADVFDYLSQQPDPADLLVAHAFLDLIPLSDKLPDILSFSRNLAWLTINFDGASTFMPEGDRNLDREIERLYHQTMDERSTGGNSRTGRKLFGELKEIGAEILAAGASDWVVFPKDGKYPGDEAFFLEFILNFYQKSLDGHPGLEAKQFSDWLKMRRSQLASGELTYIAHQIDLLVRKSSV